MGTGDLALRVEALCAAIESLGCKGIVFKDGFFQPLPVEESPKEQHRQMFHISCKEIPA